MKKILNFLKCLMRKVKLILYTKQYLVPSNQATKKETTNLTKQSSKNNNCEIIYEEDEDKIKADTKHSSPHSSQNNNNVVDINNNNNDNSCNNNNQVTLNKNQTLHQKRNIRKIQIDTAQLNQPIQQKESINSITHTSPSTAIPTNENNESTNKNNNFISTINKSKFNKEQEKKEIAKLIASSTANKNPNLKCPIFYEGSFESPSTSAFTFDTTKKNNTEENIQKGRTNVLSARNSNNNACSVLNTNAVYPLMIKRPMSNLNVGNSTLWKKIDQYKEDPEISQKLNDIIFNIKDVQKAISEKNKERSKLGSAPMLSDNNTLTLDKDLKRFRNFERSNNSRMLIEHSTVNFQKKNDGNNNLSNLNCNNHLYGVSGGRGSYGKNSYNVGTYQSVLGKGSNSKGKKGPVKIVKQN